MRDDTAGIGEASTGGGVPGDKAEPATEGDVPPGLGLGLKQGKDRGKAGGRGPGQGAGEGACGAGAGAAQEM